MTGTPTAMVERAPMSASVSGRAPRPGRLRSPGATLGAALFLIGTSPLAAQGASRQAEVGASRQAEVGASRQADEDACRPDVFRLCTSAIPDEAAIVRCLEREARDLSPACRSVIFPDSRSTKGP